MALPPNLLQAVSSPGGGKIALVVGAGCSVEAPTSIPMSTVCSTEVHRSLLADGVLQNGDCSDPNDLSLLADAVFAKTNSQRDVVDRLCEKYDLKLAKANDGYLIAAAMLCEGVISSIVTLNFDLALSDALSDLKAGQHVGVIERPQDLPRQKAINVYYLHRNANAEDANSWVLRSVVLQEEWRNHWEPIIATRVLAAPVVVFAGLGTPVAVLIESAKLLRNALTNTTMLYQVDPIDKADSRFFQELAVDPTAYIQRGWCQFMDELSQRLLMEHVDQLRRAVERKIQEDQLPSEDIANLLARLQALGLVKVGKLRAHWLLHDRPYCPVETNALGLIADLLLTLAMVARVSGAVAVIVEDGLVEFHRSGRAVAVYVVASGLGYRSKHALEVEVELRRRQYRSRTAPPRGAIVCGTSDTSAATVTAPADVVRGNESENIVAGPAALTMFHASELRADLNQIQQVVP